MTAALLSNRFQGGEKLDEVNGSRGPHHCLKLYVSRELMSVAGETTDVASDCASCWPFDSLIYKNVNYFALVYKLFERNYFFFSLSYYCFFLFKAQLTKKSC